MLRFLFLVLSIIILTLYSLPYIIRDQAVIWLLNNGAEQATLKTVNINWLQGKIYIEQLTASAKGKPQLAVDTAEVSIHYKPILSQKIILDNILLKGVKAELNQQKESLWLGPIELSSLTSKTESNNSKAENPSNWSLGINRFNLIDINWQTIINKQDYKLFIRNGKLTSLHLWNPQQPVNLQLTGSFNNAPFHIQSNTKPLVEEKTSQLKIQINHFPIQSVTAAFIPQLHATIDANLIINLSFNSKKQQIKLTQKGKITAHNLNWQDSALAIKQTKLSWQGEAQANIEQNILQTVQSHSQITAHNSEIQQATTNQLMLDSLKLDTIFNLKKKSLQINRLSLNLEKLQLQQLQQQLKLTSLNLKGTAKTTNMNDWQINLAALVAKQLMLALGNQQVKLESIKSSAELNSADSKIWQATIPRLNLTNLEIANQNKSLIELQKAELIGLKVNHTDKIELGILQLNQLKIQGKQQPISSWNIIKIQDTYLEKLQLLQISKITMNTGSNLLVLSQKHNLPDIDWLLSGLIPRSNNKKSTTQAIDPPNQTPFRLQLKQLDLTGTNSLNIIDYGVSPAFKSTIDINKLNLAQIDTVSKQKVKFSLQATNSFAKLNAQGAIALFNKDYSGNWQLDIKDLSLPPISPYAIKYSGYYIGSGQLNLSSEGKITLGKINGSNNIRLNKLTVEAKDQSLSNEFDNKVSMPLGMAISILQDNDNNIELDIPIDGSIDDPQFGYQTIINKLAKKGLKNAALSYLTNSLQPFGALITITQMAIDADQKGTFIKLQPVIFKPGQTALSTNAQNYMQKLASMLQERKNIRLNICGTAVALDRPEVWQLLLKENSNSEQPLSKEELPKALTEQLQALAEARSNQIKSHLNEKLGIKSDRLFVCYPKIEPKSKEEPHAKLTL